MFLRVAALCVCLSWVAWCADDFHTLRQQAEHARDIHDVPNACRLYEQALAINSSWFEGWWYLGNLRFVSGQFTEAEDALHHLTDLRPDLAEGWGMRGMAAIQSHSYAAALEYMAKSIALPFQTVPGMQSVIATNHAFLLSRNGKFDDALEALKPFLHADPDPELANSLGIAALRREQMPVEVSPSDRPLTEAAGRVEAKLLTNDPGVIEAAQSLALQYPQTPGVHYLLGMVLFSKQIDMAADEFARERTLDPQNAAAISMWAYSQFALHRKLDQALPAARQALSAEPENPGFAYIFGVLSEAIGDTTEAVSALTEASKAKPGNVEYHIALAGALSKAGRFSDSATERRQALSLKFNNAN